MVILISWLFVCLFLLSYRYFNYFTLCISCVCYSMAHLICPHLLLVVFLGRLKVPLMVPPSLGRGGV